MNIGKEIRIKYILPANSFNFMFARTDSGQYYIYSHRDRVIFHVHNKADDIQSFIDKVIKIASFKYFNEKSDNCLENISQIEFEKKVEKKIKIGICLVTSDFATNFKAEVWIDNLTHEVILQLFDAGEFAKDLIKPGIPLGEIEIPDPYIEIN